MAEAQRRDSKSNAVYRRFESYLNPYRSPRGEGDAMGRQTKG